MASELVDAKNASQVRAALSDYSKDYAQLGTTAFADNAASNVDVFMTRMGQLASQWEEGTTNNANYNQMFNDTQFIQAELEDRRDKLGGAVNKARAQVQAVRDKAALQYYRMGWYAFVSSMARYSLFVVASTCAFLALAATGGLSRPAAYTLIGVTSGIVLLFMIGYATRTAARRRDKWDRFYWAPLESSSK